MMAREGGRGRGESSLKGPQAIAGEDARSGSTRGGLGREKLTLWIAGKVIERYLITR